MQVPQNHVAAFRLMEARHGVSLKKNDRAKLLLHLAQKIMQGFMIRHPRRNQPPLNLIQWQAMRVNWATLGGTTGNNTKTGTNFGSLQKTRRSKGRFEHSRIQLSTVPVYVTPDPGKFC
ncbi:hypothetical protein [Acetobacter phage phiAX1]|nr:hypothetical protein [Acetobacter phage phiAX1]